MSMGSWGLREARAQRRRQVRARIVIGIFIVILAILSAIFAYQTGTLQAQKPIIDLERQVEELQAKIAALDEENRALRAEREAAVAEAEAWKARLDRALPNEEAKALLDLIGERLGAGVSANRLTFVLGAVRPESACAAEVVTKRFLVRTPLYEGGNDSVSFGSDAVTVAAEGVNAVDADGKAEAWFDPGQDVTLTFARPGKETITARGTLPLSRTILADGYEYRFTATTGPQGFVKIAGQRCPFP